MRKFNLFITLFLFLITLSGVVAAQQMSDTQVIEYVKDGLSQGKSQNQLLGELMTRGVTRSQLERIQKEHQEEQATTNADTLSTQTRERKKDKDKVKDAKAISPADANELWDKLLNESEKQPEKQVIFGHTVFTNQNLTFEPNSNMATPENYRLGPGDEVIIDVWGASENTIRGKISPEGSIFVKNLGPVYLSGMTIKEADNHLQQQFQKIYSGISGNASQVKLTLGEIRSIQVNILGEVVVPGTYRLSAFSSIFHALYSAGGINEIGSLRSIQIMRNGRHFAYADIYDYLLNGKMNDDIRLMEGDVIIVPPHINLVSITGNVKRVMSYEMKKDETISSLLKYAGGFGGDAYTKNIRLIRLNNGREKQIFTIDDTDYSIFTLCDKDSLFVDKILDRFENLAEIHGAVYREGAYQIGEKVSTVKQLIDKAEGLRGDAFLNRAQLQREHEDLTREIISIDIRGLIDGTTADIELQRNDILYIPSIHDLSEEKTLTIHGEVAKPGIYSFADNTTIEDLIITAGGLLDAASTARIDIARRIKDPKSVNPINVVGKIFSLELKNGFIVGDKTFTLEPHDEVYVRRSPGYQTQQNVKIEGEVLFGGNHSLTKKNERISDLIAKSGGVTPDAYIKGARLTRTMTEEEIRRQEDVKRMGSVIQFSNAADQNFYHVGIDLEKALKYPGSDYDLVLREGDVLFVPEYINTIKINGAVMRPNTVSYKKGGNLKHYIEQAGGYNEHAKKSKVYAVHLNGTVLRLRGNTAKAIQPGCEIIIPTKGFKPKMTIGEMVSVGSSVATLAAVVVSMISLIK